MVGCGGMWQGGGRVWGHVAWVEACGRGQVDGMEWNMRWVWGHVVGWGHVAGCRGMWQG